MQLKTALCATILLGTAAFNTASAMDQGDWLLRGGASYVHPTSDNHDTVKVKSATSFTFNIGYMLTEAWSLELLAAWPFKHDIELLDGTKVGSTKHLPPTLSVQYHFAPNSRFQPYVGLGLNYTSFFSEKTTGPLADFDLKLDSSWGLEGEIGADFMLNDKIFLNGSIRYIDIESDAKLVGFERNGTDIGTVKIDPWVYSANVGFRF